MKITKSKIIIFLILLILVFIFSNSMMNTEISSKISMSFRAFIETIIPYGKFKFFDLFLTYYIRKAAHFFEYMLFGFLISKFYVFKCQFKIQKLINGIAVCFFIGLLDETIQIFTGRQSRVEDVWIDLFGFCFTIVVYKIFDFIIKKFISIFNK